MDDYLKQLLATGREHYAKGEHEPAEAALRQVVQRGGDFADVHEMLGVIAHAKGDLAGAEKFFSRAVELNPSFTAALLNLAVTLNDLGKYAEARQVYERIRHIQKPTTPAELDPYARGKIANLHAGVAEAYADSGLRAAAIEELRKAVALCPTFADLRTRLANLLRDEGRHDAAIEQYEAARDANQDYVPAWLNLGLARLARGEVDEARAAWREVLARDPSHKSAAAYLRMADANPTTPRVVS